MKKIVFFFALLLLLGGCAENRHVVLVGASFDRTGYQQELFQKVQRFSPYQLIVQNEERGLWMRVSARYPDGKCVVIAELGPEEGSKKFSAECSEFTLIFEAREFINGRWRPYKNPVIEKKMKMYPSETGRVRTLYVSRYRLDSEAFGWDIGFPSIYY